MYMDPKSTKNRTQWVYMYLEPAKNWTYWFYMDLDLALELDLMGFHGLDSIYLKCFFFGKVWILGLSRG